MEPRISDDDERRVCAIIKRAKRLAKDYYRITGRPLGITGEIAECEAVRILRVERAPVRQSGFDAVRKNSTGLTRLQIKARCFGPDAKPGQRIGSIQVKKKDWDAVLLVLMDLDLEVREIWEAKRRAIEKALKKPGSKARNVRGALAVRQFKKIGRQVWPVGSR